jgi:hypothetical protein
LLYVLVEGEIHPLREAGAEAVKRITILPELQKFSSEGFGMATKCESL